MSAPILHHSSRRRRSPAIAPAVVIRDGRATTAQLLADASSPLAPVRLTDGADELSERERLLAALGFALHHLTEPLGSAVSMLDTHRATTVLTKQIATALESVDAVHAVARLLTDPDRLAMPDGRSAREFCGPTWHYVAATSIKRVDAALDGVAQYGSPVVARLACLRGLQASGPWWGTEFWNECAEGWFAEHRLAPRLRSALLRRPERVDDAIIADILNRALDIDDADAPPTLAIRHAG